MSLMDYKVKTIIESGKEYKIYLYGSFSNDIKWNDIKWTILNEKVSKSIWLTHREKGPAIIRIYKDKTFIWYKFGKNHRLDGPASIYFHSNNKKISKSWWINGNRFAKNQHDKVRTMLSLGLDKI